MYVSTDPVHFFMKEKPERNWPGLDDMSVRGKFQIFPWLPLQENCILYLLHLPPDTVWEEQHLTIVYGHQTL